VVRRRKLPDERQAITHKFAVGGHEGYLTVGMYEDGQPGEIFLVMAKEGSTISGLMDAFATSVSIALQYGVPLQTLVDKFSHTRFEPSGFTKNPDIPMAKSITDYIFRWLASRFLGPEEQRAAGIVRREGAKPAAAGGDSGAAAPAVAAERPAGASDAPAAAAGPSPVTFLMQQDAPSCSDCGSIMVRNGSCYKCLECGSTSGCS
jgi:ribonucleoside-diphosphate reductase alpha chain